MSSTKPRPPKLNKLKGSYEIPKTLREEAQLNSSILLAPAREWGNIKSVVDSYLGVSLVWERTGADFLSLLQASFGQILKTLEEQSSSASSSLLVQYISSLVTYYKSNKIKHDVDALYQQAELQRRVERNNAETTLQAESAMSVLMTQKGREKEDAIRGVALEVPFNDADIVLSQQGNSTESSQPTSSSYLPQSDSSSDDEEMPTKMQDTYNYLISTNNDDAITLSLDTHVWKLSNGTNITDAFVSARNRLVEKCRAPTSKISDDEQLALSGILLLDIDRTSNILKHLDHLNAHKEMENDYKEKFTAVGEDAWMHDVLKCLNLIRTATTLSFDTAVESSTLQPLIKSILRSLARTYSRQYSIKGVNENTIVKDYFVPMLDAVFPNNDYLTTYAADKEIKESSYRFASMDPSLQKHAKKADYSVVHNPTKHTLLTVEAKSCQNHASTDLVKTGKYLKDLIDAAEVNGYQGLRLLGLVSRGEHISIYVVEHKNDFVYTMFKLDTLHIPVKYTDIHRALPVFEVLPRLKLIVNSNVDLMNKPEKPSVLKRVHTYHTPIAMPDQRVKRLANKSSLAFKAARRKLF